MNAIILLTLIAIVVSFLFGIIVYFFNRRALLNKIFFITIFFGFIYALSEAMMW